MEYEVLEQRGGQYLVTSGVFSDMLVREKTRYKCPLKHLMD